MFLVIGLGNPGSRYVDTRHNIGFLVADALARRAAVGIEREQLGASVARAQLVGHQVVLAKPQKFMNLSGGPGQALRDFYKVEIDHVVVVHDDLDLPAGDVRVKVGGGHGGHNGLRDLIQHMGGGFVRVRMGIARPPAGWETADYVLGRWSDAEAIGLADFVARGADAVEQVLSDGVAKAMQSRNTRSDRQERGPGERGRAGGTDRSIRVMPSFQAVGGVGDAVPTMLQGV